MLIRRKIYAIYVLALAAGAVGFNDAAMSIKAIEPIAGIDIYSLFLGGVYLVLSMSIMEYFVFYRLRQMNKELARIKDEGYCSNKRLFDNSGDDEIGSIIESINSALELAYEKSKHGEVINELYHSLVHDSPVLVYRFNTEGTVTFVSDSYAAAYNMPKSKIVEGNIYEHIKQLGGNADDIRHRIQVLGPNRRATSFTYDTPLVVNQDVPKWLAWSVSAILDDKDNVLEYQAVGVNMYKHEVAVTAEKLVRNQKVEEIILESIHEDDKASIAEGFQQAVATGSTVHRNCRVMKEGRYVPMQLSIAEGECGEMMVCALDITEIKYAHKEVVGAVENMNRVIISSGRGHQSVVSKAN